MPKEFIHCRDFGRSFPVLFDGSDEDQTVVQMSEPTTTAVKVGWSKEQEHVEIAVVRSIEGAFVEHDWETENEEDGSVEVTPGPLYIQMDRAGLNRLIRTLRQARDDAFGKDE